MNLPQKLNPEWPLRLGLGLMYLYSGFDLLTKPQHWYGFVPKWLSQILNRLPYASPLDAYLRLQGAVELLIGLTFLAWFLPKKWLKLAAFLALLEMVLVLIFVGIDPITFRDIGLLGAAVALLIISSKGPKDGG